MNQQFFYSVFTKDGSQYRFDTEAGARACAKDNGGMIQKFPASEWSKADNTAAALAGKLPRWEPSTVNRG